MSSASAILTALSFYLKSCLACFPSSPRLRINNRSFKILRLLGEGGFSYVYLVQDTHDSSLYALKKIRCPFGEESVSQALREVEAYTLFAGHPNIIHSIDHSVVTDKSDASAKTVYVLLPYCQHGNLQDMINANLVNRSKIPQKRLMTLMLGTCKALKAMHQFQPKNTANGLNPLTAARRVKAEAATADTEAAQVAGKGKGKGKAKANGTESSPDEDGLEHDPLIDREGTWGPDGPSPDGPSPGEHYGAFAHRDIKPGNIMIGDDGTTPIVVDLGSIAPSPTHITSRALAIEVQDTAAEHSTMPYRAPELFDVKTDSVVDTKVDIWSLGCTMYACLVGRSPFEARSEETGGSLSLCVLGGDWRFPDEGQQRAKQKKVEELEISDGVRDIVRRCLKVEPSERPDADELAKLIADVIETLPDDDPDGPRN